MTVVVDVVGAVVSNEQVTGGGGPPIGTMLETFPLNERKDKRFLLSGSATGSEG